MLVRQANENKSKHTAGYTVFTMVVMLQFIFSSSHVEYRTKRRQGSYEEAVPLGTM